MRPCWPRTALGGRRIARIANSPSTPGCLGLIKERGSFQAIGWKTSNAQPSKRRPLRRKLPWLRTRDHSAGIVHTHEPIAAGEDSQGMREAASPPTPSTAAIPRDPTRASEGGSSLCRAAAVGWRLRYGNEGDLGCRRPCLAASSCRSDQGAERRAAVARLPEVAGHGARSRDGARWQQGDKQACARCSTQRRPTFSRLLMMLASTAPRSYGLLKGWLKLIRISWSRFPCGKRMLFGCHSTVSIKTLQGRYIRHWASYSHTSSQTKTFSPGGLAMGTFCGT